MTTRALALPFFVLLAASDAAGDGTLRGTVRSARSGSGVPGVLVRLSPNGGPDSVVSAGSDGAFLFGGLSAGRYSLRAEDEGGLPLPGAPATAVLGPGDDLVVDLVVSPPLHALSGRVRFGASREPAAFLSLDFRDSEGFGTTGVTDAAGRFRTEAVFAAGPVAIAESRGAFGLADPSAGHGRDSLVLGTATAGGAGPPADPEIELEMPWEARAAGRVVDSAGRPVAGADVAALAGARRQQHLLRGGIDERFARRARTGGDGAFSFDGLPSDRRIEFVAGKAGYATAVSEPVFAGYGETAYADVVLVRAARIAGRVEGPDGKPLADALVSLSRIEIGTGGPFLPCDPTPRSVDAAGRFDFHGLAPGRYHVRGEAPPFVLAPFGPVDLGENGSAAVVLRPESPALAIAGVVRDPSGAALPPHLAVVAERLVTGRGHPPARARVDASGRFTIPLREDGRYRLLARTTPLESGPATEALAGDAGVDLSWSPPRAAIVVRVTSAAEGVAVPGADILFFLAAAPDSPAVTGRAGEGGLSPRAFPAAPGRYEIVAAARGHAPARVAVEVAPGDTGERLVEIGLEPGRAVSGRVVDESGLPAAGVSVAVVAGSTPLPATAVASGADGRFTIDALPESGGAIAIVRADGFRATPVEATGGDVRLVHTSRPEGAPR